MFDLSIEKLFVLVLVALFVLGPERLPGAMSWLGRTIRQVKSYAAGTQEQLRREVGPELAQLRQPLEEFRGPVQALRGIRDPRTALTSYLLSSPTTSDDSSTTPKPVSRTPHPTPATGPAAIDHEAT